MESRERKAAACDAVGELRSRWPVLERSLLVLEGLGKSAFEFAGNKLLDAIAGDVVGNLARRMLHRVRRNRIERPADFAITRKFEAPDRVDHDSAGVRRVLHRHPQFELDRDAREAFALDAP